MYILLCGYPPFKGKNHKEIFDKIKSGKFSFQGPEWRNVSREAKVMIKKMLTFDSVSLLWYYVKFTLQSLTELYFVTNYVISQSTYSTPRKNNGQTCNPF